MSKLKDLYYQARRQSHLHGAIRQLRELERQLPAPHTRLSIPFLFRGAGFFKRIRPKQSQAEIGELYHTVLTQRPRVVLEIGTCHGGTLYLWCQAAHPQATIISIDLPEGEFGGGYRACRSPLYATFARPEQTLHLLRCDSHSPETLDRVKSLIGSQSVDLLFIDGDHTYAGVKQDFDLYRPLVGERGLIALHDILKRDEQPRIEVWKLWQELKQRHPAAHEWIDQTPGGRAIGIGLVQGPQ